MITNSPTPFLMSRTSYRPDIDGLRAFAILSVVIFHIFPKWLPGGFVGVDIFFVISGFLITTIIMESLTKQTFSFIVFYQRRIKRIFPALILVLLSVLIVAWNILLSNDYKQLGKHILGGAGFVSNFILWHESGYFDGAAHTKVLLHLWSLAIEEQFYLFWPLILWLASKRGISSLNFIIVVGVTSFILNIVKVQSDTVAAFYSPQTRFWELMVGACLAYILLNKQQFVSLEKKLATGLGKFHFLKPTVAKRLFLEILSTLGFSLLIISVCVINEKDIFPGWWATLPVLGAVLLISSENRSLLNSTFLSSRVMVWIGLISYPLYLWHWPLLSLAYLTSGDEPNTKARILIVVLSFILAWLTHKLIEKPLKSKDYVMPLLVILIVIGALGLSVYAKDGFPKRFKGLESLDITGYEFGSEWKIHSCYLQADKGDKLFPNRDNCIEKKKHIVFLWGDSFAAALYPGLNFIRQTKDYGIAFFAANSCPPILGNWDTHRPYCKEINDGNFALIKQLKPDIVLLHANWSGQEINTYPIGKLANTIALLKKSGVSRVIIIGPVPVWTDGLSRVLFNKFNTDPLHRIPIRIKPAREPNMIAINQSLELIAKKSGAEYIRSYQYFCNDNGCLDRLGNTKGSIMSNDAGHLSTAASKWFFKQIEHEIFIN